MKTTTQLKVGQTVRITGERGSKDVTDTWVVKDVTDGGDARLIRVRDRRPAMLAGYVLYWFNGPKVVHLRKHCHAEVI